jgi:DNA-binding CsgD family transcriptional regulator/tetratricopeptide (TPR) repeat protein
MMPSMSTRVVSPTLAGRRVELERLQAALDRAIEGFSSTVLVAGEAGVGKTRLVTELASSAYGRGMLVLTGGAVGLGDSDLPYGPFAEAFRALHRSVGRDRFLQAAGAGADDVARLVPDALVRRTPDGAALEEGSEARARLFGSVQGLLGRISVETPVLLALEDLQWADPSSRSLLLSTARQLTGTRVVLVGTFRSDDLGRRHPLLPTLALLERLPNVERIDLARLTPEAVQDQIAGILGSVPAPRLVDEIVERSDGNPFFVEELLAGGPQLGRSGVPPTIQDVIEVRLNALPDETQRVVRIAAVVGRQAEHDLLADLAGLSEVELIAAIRPAVDGHVLVPAEGDGRPSYAFRHALVREVAYDDLLPTERSALHRLVAEALSAQPDANEADARAAAELAYHWSGAHDDRRALEASLRAARTATEIYAHDEALEHYERAIRLWDRVPEAATETGSDLASLYDGAAAAASNAGNVRRAAELARAAVEGGPVGQTGAHGDAWARRTDRLAWYLSELGDQAGGLAVVDQALGWVGSDFPGIGTARLLTTRGMLLWGMGRYPEIVRTADAAIEAARRSGDVGIEANALLGVGAGRAAYGLLDAGIADLREAHALFLAAADPRTGIAVSQLCYALCLGGQHVEAATLIGEELERQVRIGTLRRFRPYLITDLVDSYVELGRWDEVVALCESEIAQAEGGRTAPWYVETLAEIRALRGDVEGAGELFAAASEAIGPGNAVIDRVWVMRTAIVLGRIEGNIDRVRNAIDEALRISADTAHDAPLWWLLCAALAAEADEADRSTRRRDPDGLATARARGLRLAGIIDDAALALGSDDGRWPPTLMAYVRHGAANRLRLEGQPDAAAWEAAIEAYDDLGYIYEAASCRRHLAETILGSGGSREAAGRPLRAAADTATRLRAKPLLAAVAGLASRARIDLGTETGIADDLGVGLTAREQEVLALLAGGLTNREIGETLFISEKTASVHVSNILGKLGVGGRGAAVAMAVRLGFDVDADGAVQEETAPISPAGSARRAGPCGRPG